MKDPSNCHIKLSLNLWISFCRPMLEPDKVVEALLTKTIQVPGSISQRNSGRTVNEETNRKLNELGIECVMRGHQVIKFYRKDFSGNQCSILDVTEIQPHASTSYILVNFYGHMQQSTFLKFISK